MTITLSVVEHRLDRVDRSDSGGMLIMPTKPKHRSCESEKRSIKLQYNVSFVSDLNIMHVAIFKHSEN